MRISDIKSLLGKRIERVVVHDGITTGQPRVQLFLEFEDDTFAEFYCYGEVRVSSPRMGNALEYTKMFEGGEITIFGPGVDLPTEQIK